MDSDPIQPFLSIYSSNIEVADQVTVQMTPMSNQCTYSVNTSHPLSIMNQTQSDPTADFKSNLLFYHRKFEHFKMKNKAIN